MRLVPAGAPSPFGFSTRFERRQDAVAGGLRAGLVWWCIGFPIALAYFACLFWLHRGKVTAPEEGQGY